MAVTAALIKELRGMTGVGMSDCKAALVETDGDIEKAVEVLRKKGMAKAEKKAGRVAAEGLSYAYITEDGKSAAAVEVNSETDFVAKNDIFKTFVEDVAKQAVASDSADMDAFLAETWKADTTKTVKEALVEKVSVIGENLTIRRFEKFTAEENSVFVSYLHAGGKVAVLLEFVSDVNNDTLVEAGKNICMQIAAMSPKFVRREEISAEFIAKEREILTEQAKSDPKNAGKPDNILEKMIEGRINKEMKEFCLVDQEYVQDDKISVKQYIANVAKEVGGNIDVKRFVRFETGEGIEKKEEDFAAEVAKTING
jgi:elongation factor Ts